MKKYGNNCLCIINCAAKKLDHKAAASDLYIGTDFKVKKEFAVNNFEHYCIISAKYGVLLPTDIVEPYNLLITQLTEHQREDLFKSCAKQISLYFSQCDHFYFVTTDNYVGLAEYLTGEKTFLLDGLKGRQKLHFLKTGTRDIVDLDTVLNNVSSQLEAGKAYKKSYIFNLLFNLLPDYSTTYINRIIRCSTVDSTGEKGLKQRDVFEVHDKLYYLKGSYSVHRRRKLF